MLIGRAQALPGICLCLAVGLAQAAPFGYVVNSDSLSDSDFDSLYRVDLATGDATLIGPVGYADVEGLAISPDGVLYGVDDGTETLIIIDTNTGQGTPVNNAPGNLGIDVGFNYDFGLTFDLEGNLWLSSDVTGQIWRVNPDTGAATLHFGPASGTAGAAASGDGGKSAANPGALTALASCSDRIFGLGSEGDHALYELEPNGTPRLVGLLEIGLPYDDAGLSFDGAGQLWGAADRSRVGETVLNEPTAIFTIDLNTGEGRLVSETVVGVEALAIAPPSFCLDEPAQSHPVPAVNPLALGAMLLGVLAVARRFLGGA